MQGNSLLTHHPGSLQFNRRPQVLETHTKPVAGIKVPIRQRAGAFGYTPHAQGPGVKVGIVEEEGYVIEVEGVGRAGGSARDACSECGELLDVPFLGRASVALEMWVEGSG